MIKDSLIIIVLSALCGIEVLSTWLRVNKRERLSVSSISLVYVALGDFKLSRLLFLLPPQSSTPKRQQHPRRREWVGWKDTKYGASQMQCQVWRISTFIMRHPPCRGKSMWSLMRIQIIFKGNYSRANSHTCFNQLLLHYLSLSYPSTTTSPLMHSPTQDILMKNWMFALNPGWVK